MLTKPQALELSAQIMDRLAHTRDMNDEDKQYMVADLVLAATKPDPANTVYRIKAFVGQTDYLADGVFASAEDATAALANDEAYPKDARRCYKVVRVTEEVV